MVFHKDMDVGSLTLGDLHKKSSCVQLRVEEIVQRRQHVRSTQLRLFNCGLGVENATDDIVQDLHCTRALLGEEVVIPMEKPSGTTMGFVTKVHEAMSLESFDAISMHRDFDGVGRIKTQYLSIMQLTTKLQNTPLKFVSHPTLWSSNVFLCTLHLHLLLKGIFKDCGFTGLRLLRLQ